MKKSYFKEAARSRILATLLTGLTSYSNFRFQEAKRKNKSGVCQDKQDWTPLELFIM